MWAAAERGKVHVRDKMKALLSVAPASASRATPTAQAVVSPVPFRLALGYQSPVPSSGHPSLAKTNH